MIIAQEAGDILVTHALGSCLGIAAFDADAHVGGILHAMLPSYSVSPDKAKKNPMMFVDIGTPLFFKALFKEGAKKERIVVKVAGGAAINDEGGEEFFDIGKKNLIMLRKLFHKNRVRIAGQDVGGRIVRTLHLEIGTWKTWLNYNGRLWEI